VDRPVLSIEDISRLVETWHGIALPNKAAALFAQDLPRLIEAFDRLPPGDFAAEPSDFALVLEALADPQSP
jgi:hypothetical protein